MDEKTLPTHIVAAAGIVRNGSGEILMINGRRGWEFPGSIIENGENISELKTQI